MEPIVLLVIMKLAPWVLGGVGLFALYRSPAGRALARKLHADSVTAGDVALLAEELREVRRELSEVHERLDFAERALAQQRSPVLPRPKPPDSRSPTPPEPSPTGR